VGNSPIRLGLLFRRWWLVVLLVTVEGALLAYAFGSRISTTYEANVQVLVGHPEGLSPTYAELVKSTPVLSYALRHTRQDVSLAELRDDVRGESDQNTRIVTIEADARKASQAVELANAVAAGLREYVSSKPSTATSGAAQSSEPRVEVVDPATSATRIRPRPVLLLEFGAFAGLFAGVALALVAEARTPRINAEEDLAEIRGLPVLGILNESPRAGSLVSAPTVRAGQVAAYRRLVARLALAADSELPRSLVVLGADGGHGSAKVALDLGLSFALGGERVALADFEGNGITRYLQLDGRRRVSSLLRRADPVSSAGITLDRFTLRAGPPLVLVVPRSRPDGLSVEDAATILFDLSADADIVMVHVPAPTRSRGALPWARAALGTFVVVGVGKTKRSDLEETVETLGVIGPKLLGAVLQTTAPDPSIPAGGSPRDRMKRTFPSSGGTPASSRAL
jgi:capsular polysaccharide biosynthesis protein/Mrp family chromosome partitioning ATPase